MHAVRFVRFFQLQYIVWSADKHTPSKRKKLYYSRQHMLHVSIITDYLQAVKDVSISD